MEPDTRPIRHQIFDWFATWLLLPGLLAGLLVAQASWFIRTTSETYDEYTYLRMGICIYRNNDFQSMASPMCPPLPILIEYWLPALRARFVPGTEAWEKQVPELTRLARYLTVVTLGVPLLWLVYGWLTYRRNWFVGALGGGLLALSPTVLAAVSVATTDACFAFFGVLATVCLHRYSIRPSWQTWMLAGVGIGLALGAKQSAAIFFPVAALELMHWLPPRRPGWTGVDYGLRLTLWVSNRLAVLVVLAFMVDWACYGFHFAPPFGLSGVYSTIPVIIPIVLAFFPNGDAIMDSIRALGPPLAIDTFVGQMEHAKQGHAAFLMGAHSFRGWWSFFPIALAIKSTPAELCLLGLGLVQICRSATWRDPSRRVWLTSALALLAAGMASSINIGQRYMLLVYPLVTLAGLDWLGEKLATRRGWGIVLGVALIGWQGVSVAGVMPHYFGYFNSLIGGPTQGYRYLVDSSLDWGQDLPTLRRELEARNYHSVALYYFGTAQTRTYGLRTTDPYTRDEPTAAACDWVAISATSMMGAYGKTGSLYERFKDLPSTQVGYANFLYDLSDPKVRATWNQHRRESTGVGPIAE